MSAIQPVSELVPAASALLAALTFAFSVYKQRSDQSFSREVEAKKVWREYLELAYDHPEFSSGFSGSKSDRLQFEKYEWFVSRMLFAAEEVLQYAPNSPEWMNVIQTQVGYHNEYFKREGAAYIPHYAESLREIMRLSNA